MIQQRMRIEYAIEPAQFGLPASMQPAIFENREEAEKADRLLTEAVKSGALVLVTSNLHKWGSNSCDYPNYMRAPTRRKDTLKKIIARLGELNRLLQRWPRDDIIKALVIIRAGRANELHSFDAWMVGPYRDWVATYLAQSLEEAQHYLEKAFQGRLKGSYTQTPEGGFYRWGEPEYGLFHLKWTRDGQTLLEEGKEK